MGMDGVPVVGIVVWERDSEEILGVLHAPKINPEIIHKKIMRDFISQ
jgi:hypothetical protein